MNVPVRGSLEYADFIPSEYLVEYYTNLDSENKFLLESLHDIYGGIDRGLTFLELGGGPTVYQLISLSRVAKSLEFFDIKVENLRETAAWFNGSSASFNWNRYLEYVALLENVCINELIKRMRDIDICFIEGDIYSCVLPKVDVVTSIFCIESITNNLDRYGFLFERVKLSASKYIVMASLRNARAYKVFEKRYQAFPVNELDIISFLSPEFEVVKMFSEECNPERGYDGMVVTLAKRVGV